MPVWGAILLIAIFAAASYWTKKLDALGALSGFVIALGVYLGGGFESLWLLFLFFVLGVSASKWKEREKEAMRLSQAQEGIRSWGNAWGNGGVAAMAGYALFLFPEQYFLLLLLSGSLAGATADTLSSELGNVYGRRYVDILSWKKARRGDNGVVSLEGSLCGLMGAAAIALFVPEYFWAIFLGGLAGTLADSILGATLERQGFIGNDAVNLLSSLIAGGLAASLGGVV